MISGVVVSVRAAIEAALSMVEVAGNMGAANELAEDQRQY